MAFIYTGRPVPLDGKRKLTGREAIQRAKAMDCIRSRQSTQCQGQIYVGLFFDGTGNNDAWMEEGHAETQRERNKHSNVARLFDAHLNEPDNGFFRYYLPGVGTPFSDIKDTSKWLYDKFGMGFGFRGADRINYGIISILNAASLYLTNSPLLPGAGTGALASAISTDARSPISTEGAIRWAALTALEERLAGIIRSHQRKLVQINVSIFGFSRGAAEARACAFWLSQICERQSGAMQLAGVPIRIGFMGIFDTVAAVGIGDVTPFTEGHMAWANGTQTIHPAVEDCVHFIALHEQRASFPLEAAVGRANVAYPGMHSDVGGGYFPGEQGKCMPEWSASPHLSQIPLLDMHFAAIKAGVPMMSIEQILKDSGLAKSFSVDQRLVEIYNTWLAHHGVSGGDAQAYTEAHARHYIRWRAQLHLDPGKGIQGLAFFGRAKSGTDQADMKATDESLRVQLLWLLERRRANSSVRRYVTERLKEVIRLTSPLGPLIVEPGKAPLTAYERKFIEIAADDPIPPRGCAELFADYVHDSRAGFKPLNGMQEPIIATGGYLRFRHIFKEEIHRESVVYGWANEGLASAKSAGNTVAQFFSDLWDAGISAYKATRQRISLAARAALQYASSSYQAAENRVLTDYQQAERELYRQLHLRYPGNG